MASGSFVPADDIPPSLRVDGHQHFWDIESGAYDWPTPADGAIYRTFGPEDLRTELAGARIHRTVLVQTVDTLADTDAMLDAARDHDFVAGVVGWVPLTEVDAASSELERRAGPKLRGIRHLIHREPDPEWLLRDDVNDGLRLLSRLGLTFDVVAVFPDHLRLVPSVADAHPDLVVIIDHLGKPPFRADGWDRWCAELRSAGERPNVVAKVSGLDTAAGEGWDVDALRPAFDVALEAFGASRLLFGSDWPVCRSVSTYAAVVAATDRLVSTLTHDEQVAIMGGTAARVYGLPGPSAGSRA